MKKKGEGNKLGAEELERRMAPGRLAHIEPPVPSDPGGGGGSMPVNPGDPDPEPRRHAVKSGGRRQRLFTRD